MSSTKPSGPWQPPADDSEWVTVETKKRPSLFWLPFRLAGWFLAGSMFITLRFPQLPINVALLLSVAFSLAMSLAPVRRQYSYRQRRER